MKSPTLNCAEVEACVTGLNGVFPLTRYIILPRARWGVPGIDHECDLLAISKAGYAQEIEIKVSRADLLADKRKRHSHKSDMIRRFWYAVPSKLKEFALENIPPHAGLIECFWTGKYFKSWVVRPPVTVKAQKIDSNTLKHILELIAMRYWAERSRSIVNLRKAKTGILR